VHRDHSDRLLFSQTHFQSRFARRLDLVAAHGLRLARLNVRLSPHSAPAKTTGLSYGNSSYVTEPLPVRCRFDSQLSTTAH
jgi:hypothetical protein